MYSLRFFSKITSSQGRLCAMFTSDSFRLPQYATLPFTQIRITAILTMQEYCFMYVLAQNVNFLINENKMLILTVRSVNKLYAG